MQEVAVLGEVLLALAGGFEGELVKSKKINGAVTFYLNCEPSSYLRVRVQLRKYCKN